MISLASLFLLATIFIVQHLHVAGFVSPRTIPSGVARCHYYGTCCPVDLLRSTKKPLDGDNEGDYKKKLAQLDDAIANAEKERQKLLQAELDRYETKGDLVSVDEWSPRELKMPPPPRAQPSSEMTTTTGRIKKSSSRPRTMATRSKVTRSDAGTLVIEITPQGVSSGVLFNGVFSVAWFSAIVPATFAALSGGLVTGLFLLPFWAAGGMVAKQGFVDPFVSSTLTVGQYAWSVEGRLTKAQIQKKEGATEDLQGAKLECPLVVNNVPQYQVSLYDSKMGVTALGQGLPEEELQKVVDEVNEYLDDLGSGDQEMEALPWKN